MLGLGTGGHALVVALPDRLPPDPPDAGRLVKARYLPLQVLVAEPGKAKVGGAEFLDGMPVVVAFERPEDSEAIPVFRPAPHR